MNTPWPGQTLVRRTIDLSGELESRGCRVFLEVRPPAPITPRRIVLEPAWAGACLSLNSLGIGLYRYWDEEVGREWAPTGWLRKHNAHEWHVVGAIQCRARETLMLDVHRLAGGFLLPKTRTCEGVFSDQPVSFRFTVTNERVSE